MNFDLKTEVKRMGLGLISALIMAVNIKTLVRAGGCIQVALTELPF